MRRDGNVGRGLVPRLRIRLARGRARAPALRFALCTALGLASTAARADVGRTARVAWTDVPPVIDGSLDDAAWRRARASGRFVERPTVLRGTPPVRTWFRVPAVPQALDVVLHPHQPPSPIPHHHPPHHPGPIYPH